MNSAKNLALAVLTIVAIGGALLAWKQQAELQTLRAAAANVDDREELKRRALAAERRAKDLADELAALRDKQADAKADLAKAERAKPTAAPGDAMNMRTLMTSAANMMNRPEMQRMMALGQKAALDANYAKLFKQLNLDPDKLEQLKKLMVERSTVGADVFAAAAQQGLDPMQSRRELAKLTADGQAKVDGEIKSLLGDADYSSYQNYQATLPQRSVVNQLQQSLSYTASPLSDSQAEQLVQILAANPVARPAVAGGPQPTGDHVEVNRTVVVTGSSGGGGDGTATKMIASIGPGGPMGLGGAQISDSAVAASRTVLDDSQYAALQQMQQQQNQLRSMMQAAGGAPGQGGMGIIQFNSTTTSSGGTPPPPPPPDSGTKPPGGE